MTPVGVKPLTLAELMHALPVEQDSKLNICFSRSWISLLSGTDVLTQNKRWYHLNQSGD